MVKKFLSGMQNISNLWILVVVPILSFIANLFLSEIQNELGINTILISLGFLITLLSGIIFVNNKLLTNSIKKIVYPRIEVEINQPIKDANNYDYLFKESIITDRQLSLMEKKCDCEEIWVA